MKCLKQAVDSYLRWESRLHLSRMFKTSGVSTGCDEISGSILLALRIFTNNSKKKLLKMNGDELKTNDVPDCDSDEGQLGQIKMLFGMVRHHEKRTEADLLAGALKTVFIMMLLLECQYLEGSLDDEENQLVGRLIFEALEAIQYNSHPIDQAKGDIRPSSHVNLEEIGSAVYPLIASVCNHSCDPSTIRISIGRDLYMIARRQIQPGEEISDCYGFHYTSLHEKERKRRIKRWYNFECTCEACSNHFPTMANLHSSCNKQVAELMEEARKQLESNNLSCISSAAKYLSTLSDMEFGKPHKAYEAGSHLLSCSLWKMAGNKA